MKVLTLLLAIFTALVILLAFGRAVSAASADPIAFSKLAIQQASGLVTVIGEAQNRTLKVVSFTVAVGLYTPSGTLLGVATGAVNELHPGRTKVFQAIATMPLSGTVRMVPQVDSIVPACP